MSSACSDYCGNFLIIYLFSEPYDVEGVYTAKSIKQGVSMAKSHEVAHIAMRELWGKADKRLQQPDAIDRLLETITIREVETELGLKISSYGGYLMLCADFEKPDGTDETIEVTFPQDIRDLSHTMIHVNWSNETGAGSNTPPMREFPKIVQELLVLI